MLGKATTLASGWIYHGDPSWYATNIKELLAVTAADVKRVAERVLAGPVQMSVIGPFARDSAFRLAIGA
jgi:predicted Zn-dependent peptidase